MIPLILNWRRHKGDERLNRHSSNFNMLVLPLQMRMQTFLTHRSSWPDEMHQSESTAVIRCARECLSVPSCKAFTYEGDRQLCSLHNATLGMDQYLTVRKRQGKYVQMGKLVRSFIHPKQKRTLHTHTYIV